MSSWEPVRLASVGLGGYAGAMSDNFVRVAAEKNPPIKLEAICEPDQKLHAERVAKLKSLGVKVFAELDEMLAEPVEAVWLPLPIDLHRSFTEKVAAAGKSVICEKPAAGSLDDLEAMIAARDKAGVKGAIAFQDIYDDVNLAVKKELLSGMIGKIKQVTLHACWTRGEKYYGRSTWAGKNKRNGVWVMDSPANNALAHYINLALFFMGTTERSWADPVSVAAELYRVNPIETYDTCSLRVTVEGQIPLLILLTHACQLQTLPRIDIEGARGRLRYVATDQAIFESNSAHKTISLKSDNRGQMIHKLARWIRGTGNELVASFESARHHLKIINGASEATAVRTIDPKYVQVITKPEGEKLRAIPDIEAAFAKCATSSEMLSESGLVPWAVQPGVKSLENYHSFAGPLK